MAKSPESGALDTLKRKRVQIKVTGEDPSSLCGVLHYVDVYTYGLIEDCALPPTDDNQQPAVTVVHKSHVVFLRELGRHR